MAHQKKSFVKYYNHKNISEYKLSDIININKYSKLIFFDINSYKDHLPSSSEIIISINVLHLAKSLNKTLNYLYSFQNVKRVIFTVPYADMIENKKKNLINPIYVYCLDLGLKIKLSKNFGYYCNEIEKTPFKIKEAKKIYFDNYILGFYFDITK